MMKTVRAIGLSAVAAALVLSGCSTATPPRAQETSTTTTSATCPSGTVLTKIGKCDPVDGTTTTTTSPSAAPNANPTAALPSVSACDGTQCDLTNSDDEIDRLVAESLADVNKMWASSNVSVTLHLYKDGAPDCQSGRIASATAWTCVDTRTGGWNPALLRTWAANHDATLEDTVRATIAHEVGHVIIDSFGASTDDMVTDETRADCMAAG
ncbi:MAG: hypothetical protein KDB26_16185, partial [Microthrixaceae bacterium]|nr:hypothetical protein [Microthrixaceae bacterium]